MMGSVRSFLKFTYSVYLPGRIKKNLVNLGTWSNAFFFMSWMVLGFYFYLGYVHKLWLNPLIWIVGLLWVYSVLFWHYKKYIGGEYVAWEREKR